MTISALIPTYNRCTYVCRAIDSVLEQTLRVNEIILVDDGSTDGTVDKIRSRYGSCVAVFLQDHKGVSAARNRAIEEARGEWVAFLDSDDFWLPTKLEHQFEALQKFGGDFGACFTNCKYLGNRSLCLSAFEEAGLHSTSDIGVLHNPIEYVLGRYLGIYVQSLLVQRPLLNEVGGFDTALAHGEDRDLIFRLAFKTKFCFVSAPLVQIDRTDGVPRLTGLLAHKSDETYASIEYWLKKWRNTPELGDANLRDAIDAELVALHYGAAAEKISDGRFGGALGEITQLNRLGLGYAEILLRLALRAARKACRRLHITAG